MHQNVQQVMFLVVPTAAMTVYNALLLKYQINPELDVLIRLLLAHVPKDTKTNL